MAGGARRQQMSLPGQLGALSARPRRVSEPQEQDSASGEGAWYGGTSPGAAPGGRGQPWSLRCSRDLGCVGCGSGGWSCCSVGCEGLKCFSGMWSAAVLAPSARYCIPFTFPGEFPQHCFCNGLVEVHDPVRDLSKTFMSLAEWLPGEVGFSSLERQAELLVNS